MFIVYSDDDMNMSIKIGRIALHVNDSVACVQRIENMHCEQWYVTTTSYATLTDAGARVEVKANAGPFIISPKIAIKIHDRDRALKMGILTELRTPLKMFTTPSQVFLIRHDLRYRRHRHFTTTKHNY